jgi:hypothetical protein
LEEHVERMQRNRFVRVSVVSTRIIINIFTINNCGTTQKDKDNFLNANITGFLNLKIQLAPEGEEEEKEREKRNCLALQAECAYHSGREV